MTIKQGPINGLCSDIYPLIASHLPLYIAPSTLLALALTNRYISQITIPILYIRLVLKNEKDTTSILQRLLDNPSFGRIVRELHIMSNLSLETRNQVPPSDVVRRVENVISSGCLPLIHTLSLHLMKGWYYDEKFKCFDGFGELPKPFWIQLKEKCPRLRNLALTGFRDHFEDPWLENIGLIEATDITSLTIRLGKFSFYEKHLRHILSLASSLRILDVTVRSSEKIPVSSIFECDLPSLRSLSLGSFSEGDTIQAMEFFLRHPLIEHLDLTSSWIGSQCWFSSNLPENLLPNLRYLGARWDDVRFLAPILHQLTSLSIRNSVNAQIPYLLRSVLPGGLPQLKSLDIGQAPSSKSKSNRTIEGRLWFEDDDGSFQRAKTNKKSRTVFDKYMHSIVRAAPNLEELGFHGALFPLSSLVSIAGDLNGFPRLKELFY